MKDISKLNKKELKDYVNTQGFYFHLNCDRLEKEEVNELLLQTDALSTGVELPDGEDIIVYKGVASQNYAKGEKSRNGYKYDQKGWSFDDYFINPIVLFQHDTEKPIGNAIKFWWDKSKNLNIMFFVYKDALDGTEKFRVEKGLIKAISTGAISDEYKFEDSEDGKLLTEEEAEKKYGWSDLINAYYGMSDLLTLVITKARMLENSLVTIGSNEKAMAIQNGIGKFAENKAEELKAKYSKDEAEIETTPTEETPQEEKEEVIETENTVEEPKEVETEDNSVETEDVTPTEDVKEEETAEVVGEETEDVKEDKTPTEDEEKTQEENKVSLDSLDKLDGKISEIKNNLDKLEKDFVSNETLATVNDTLQSMKDDFANSKKELEDKLKSVEECNEALVDTITELTGKLSNTIFDSASLYKADDKITSKLGKKLELVKNSL